MEDFDALKRRVEVDRHLADLGRRREAGRALLEVHQRGGTTLGIDTDVDDELPYRDRRLHGRGGERAHQ